MALAERAELVARLSLKDDFSGPLRRVQGNFGTSMGRIGTIAQRGVRTAATNIARIGLVAGAGLAAAVKGGLDSLATVESASMAAGAAIKQMGLTGRVTAAQIAQWSQEIEASVGAAFDDKAILAASTTLIRFGHVASSNLRPALVVMTDLATKTGSVDSAASLLAKALAAPEKAAGRLARAGVILTKEQQKQITALVKAGKVAQAQKIVLDAITVATKGAAAASQGPYQRALSVLKDVTEDAERALATGFLPVIERVSDLLSKELAKPQTLANIKEFGQGLAKGLDHLIDIAQKIPWSSIGDAMKLAGQGAKAALDIFTGLPPWIQTAVLTGWGLNKLTGGAVGGIIGELGKGLIKGVLGMNAGIVNINAGVVRGGGLPIGGIGGAAGAAAGGVSLAAVAAAGIATGAAAAAVYLAQQHISAQTSHQAAGIRTTFENRLPTMSFNQMQTSLSAINTGIAKITGNPLLVLVQGDALDQLHQMRSELVDRLPEANSAQRHLTQEAIEKQRVANDKLETLRQTIVAKQDAANAKLERIATKPTDLDVSTSVRINSSVSISIRDVNKANTTKYSYSAGTTNKYSPVAY